MYSRYKEESIREDYIALVKALSEYQNADVLKIVKQKECAPLLHTYAPNPLTIAAKFGNSCGVQHLLNAGADIERKDSDDGIAFVLVDDGGDGRSVKILPRSVARVKVPCDTALMVASTLDDTTCLKVLLNAGAITDTINLLNKTALMHAVEHGACEAVKILLEKGAEVNAKDVFQQTPVSVAATQTNTACLRLLLDAGADTESKNIVEETALLKAVKGRNNEAVKILTDYRAYVNVVDLDNKTPLMIAAEQENIACLQLLIDVGADTEKLSGGKTVLMQAVSERREEVVRILLLNGACVDAMDKNGDTALVVAARQKATTCIELLLNAGADADVKALKGDTILVGAIKDKNIALAKLLLQHGACVNALSFNGESLLITAIKSSCDELASILIDKGASVNMADRDGKTAIWEAVGQKNISCLKVLLAAGADTEVKHGGKTVLLQLVDDQKESVLLTLGNKSVLESFRNDKLSRLKLLLQAGADTEAKNDRGVTLLGLAVRRKDTEVAKLLVENGANVNATDCNTEPILMTALSSGCNADMINTLIDSGAKVDSRNEKGQTPLTIAIENSCHQDIVDMLINAGADIHGISGVGNPPIFEALWCRNNVAFALLIKHGASVNARDSSGQTAVATAINCYNNEALSILIENGADLDNNQTALINAINCFNDGAVRMLLERGANVELKGCRNKRTPIHFAVLGNRDAVNPLLEHGACVNTTDMFGNTPLMHAVRNCIRNDDKQTSLFHRQCPKTSDRDVVRLLLQHGACANATYDNGESLLMYALKRGSSAVAEALIPFSASTDGTDENGRTMLSLSAQMCAFFCVQSLLQKGTGQINSQDAAGYTALMYLLKRELYTPDLQKTLVMFLGNGACVNTKAKDGETPLKLVLENFYNGGQSHLLAQRSINWYWDVRTDLDCIRSIMIKLLHHGADMSLVTDNNKYLNQMISQKKNSIVQKMISNGCGPRCFPHSLNRGETSVLRSPLEVALLTNNKGAFKYLLTIRFITNKDTHQIANGFQTLLRGSRSANRMRSFARSTMQPLSLSTLCFVVVSCALETEGQNGGDNTGKLTRREKVELLGLPVILRKALLFQELSAFVKPTRWNEITNTVL